MILNSGNIIFFAIKYNTGKLFSSNIFNPRDFYSYYKKLYYTEKKYFIKYFYFKKKFDEKRYNKKKKAKSNDIKEVLKKFKINLPFNSILIAKFVDTISVLIYNFKFLAINTPFDDIEFFPLEIAFFILSDAFKSE